MATDRAVSVPPSKSRTPAGVRGGAPHHGQRDDIHVAFLTLACAIICWRDPRAVVAVGGPLVDQTSARTCPGGVTGLTIEVNDPAAAARRWAAVLGISAAGSGDPVVLELPDRGQRLRSYLPGPVAERESQR
jgi:hypothetical protein